MELEDLEQLNLDDEEHFEEPSSGVISMASAETRRE